MPLDKAPEEVTARGGNRKPLMIQTHGSKFVQFQEVKIQEMACEVRGPNYLMLQMLFTKTMPTQAQRKPCILQFGSVFLLLGFTDFSRSGTCTFFWCQAMRVVYEAKSQ